MAEFTKTIVTTIHCPSCASPSVIKHGQQSGQQRYRCKECNKAFRHNGKAEGRKVPAEWIGAAIRMYYSGTSYKQIAEHMRDAYGISEPSKATVYEWVRDYTQAALDVMKDCPAQTGGEWVADEMMIDVGGEKYWNWNVMDSKTRYLLASHLSRERDEDAAKAVMLKAVAAAVNPPRAITTDGLPSYAPAIKEVFPDAKHIQSEGIRAETNNNLSERMQGTFRQRTKTLRGLENQSSGQRYLDGWVLNYNLFREHESLDYQPPGNVALVNAPFQEWADVTRGTAAPPSETEGKSAHAQTDIRRWASEHQEAVNEYHGNPTLTWRAMPVTDIMDNPARQRVHLSSPAPGSHKGSRYFIARLEDGGLAWVRVSNRWGDLPPSTKDGEARSWELEGGRRTRKGEFAKTTQAGYIPVAEDGRLKGDAGRDGPKAPDSRQLPLAKLRRSAGRAHRNNPLPKPKPVAVGNGRAGKRKRAKPNIDKPMARRR